MLVEGKSPKGSRERTAKEKADAVKIEKKTQKSAQISVSATNEGKHRSEEQMAKPNGGMVKGQDKEGVDRPEQGSQKRTLQTASVAEDPAAEKEYQKVHNEIENKIQIKIYGQGNLLSGTR